MAWPGHLSVQRPGRHPMAQLGFGGPGRAAPTPVPGRPGPLHQCPGAVPGRPPGRRRRLAADRVLRPGPQPAPHAGVVPGQNGVCRGDRRGLRRCAAHPVLRSQAPDVRRRVPRQRLFRPEPGSADPSGAPLGPAAAVCRLSGGTQPAPAPDPAVARLPAVPGRRRPGACALPGGPGAVSALAAGSQRTADSPVCPARVQRPAPGQTTVS